MFSIEFITTFLGWCSVINIGILILSSALLIVFKQTITALHSRLFGLDKEILALAYFQYLGNYKVAIFILNIVPYTALKLMY
ncbi:MAG: hypothetical protein HRT92_07345 [Piscirickettsiaceae bacterium]|nr:hypothetical protein [Piscirickettsiaceae bacterium]